MPSENSFTYYSNGDVAYSSTEYTLHGKTIVHMIQGSDSLHFFYDAQNRPAVVEWNNGFTTAKYAYVHNLQGDIVGIVDVSGNEMVKYTYSARGKVLSTTGSLASSLGVYQPFRYRGYEYDVETGLYYLRSRYYNPNWQRFVNADALIKGNLFAYCCSKPIVRYDPSGHKEAFVDYTVEINQALGNALEIFKSHFVKNSFNDFKNHIPTTSDLFTSLNDYYWFMEQMDNDEPWDLKSDKGWEAQFPNIKVHSCDEKFIFRGCEITKEDLGNICYGYLGTAMGVNPELLYACGGVVCILGQQKKDVKDLLNLSSVFELADMILSNLNNPPCYGDDENDHHMIEFGINMYYIDFPNM